MVISSIKSIMPRCLAFDTMDTCHTQEACFQVYEDPDWSFYSNHVSCHSRANVFHTGAWAKLITQTYQHRPMILRLGAATGDRFADSSPQQAQVLPIMEINSSLTGRRGVSLPYADECAPLCEDPLLFSRLLQEATRFGEKRRWRHLECRGGANLLARCQPSIRYYGHRLTLDQPVDQLLAACGSAIRRGIRKAEREGVRVEFTGSAQGMREYFRLHGLTRRKHGLPSQPWLFFLNLHRELIDKGSGFVALAQIGCKAIAGAVFLSHRNHAIYKFGASDPAFQGMRPSNLVMWRGIERLARDGYQVLEFGRTSLSNEGLRRFKLGWGTQEYLIEYLRWSIRGKRFVQVRDRVSGWHNPVFRLLPSICSRWLGAILYRHLD
jgi:CelD/BcsL family acetyltransferase involved in cellulose biosynthesis